MNRNYRSAGACLDSLRAISHMSLRAKRSCNAADEVREARLSISDLLRDQSRFKNCQRCFASLNMTMLVRSLSFHSMRQARESLSLRRQVEGIATALAPVRCRKAKAPAGCGLRS